MSYNDPRLSWLKSDINEEKKKEKERRARTLVMKSERNIECVMLQEKKEVRGGPLTILYFFFDILSDVVLVRSLFFFSFVLSSRYKRRYIDINPSA